MSNTPELTASAITMWDVGALINPPGLGSLRQDQRFVTLDRTAPRVHPLARVTNGHIHILHLHLYE